MGLLSLPDVRFFGWASCSLDDRGDVSFCPHRQGGFSKDSFKLYDSVLKYLQDLDICIVKSEVNNYGARFQDDFPKVIRRGEIVLGNGEGYPSLDELAEGFSNDIEFCKHVSIKERQDGDKKVRFLYVFFFVNYNSKPAPKFDKDSTKNDDYKRSMRLWRNNNKTLIEMVRIYYE